MSETIIVHCLKCKARREARVTERATLKTGALVAVNAKLEVTHLRQLGIDPPPCRLPGRTARLHAREILRL